jgi:hypothetical protein
MFMTHRHTKHNANNTISPLTVAIKTKAKPGQALGALRRLKLPDFQTIGT